MAERKQFLLRIDKKVFNAIEQWSNEEFRSVNGHIEYILREAIIKSGRANLLKHTKEEKEEE
ncbi:MAG: toxin-antitoxin system HicB family antitoxin [Candidatus Sericytochromatia bacterium]